VFSFGVNIKFLPQRKPLGKKGLKIKRKIKTMDAQQGSASPNPAASFFSMTMSVAPLDVSPDEVRQAFFSFFSNNEGHF
jgi:hypothetical protein